MATSCTAAERTWPGGQHSRPGQRHAASLAPHPLHGAALHRTPQKVLAQHLQRVPQELSGTCAPRLPYRHSRSAGSKQAHLANRPVHLYGGGRQAQGAGQLGGGLEAALERGCHDLRHATPFEQGGSRACLLCAVALQFGRARQQGGSRAQARQQDGCEVQSACLLRSSHKARQSTISPVVPAQPHGAPAVGPRAARHWPTRRVGPHQAAGRAAGPAALGCAWQAASFCLTEFEVTSCYIAPLGLPRR